MAAIGSIQSAIHSQVLDAYLTRHEQLAKRRLFDRRASGRGKSPRRRVCTACVSQQSRRAEIIEYEAFDVRRLRNGSVALKAGEERVAPAQMG